MKINRVIQRKVRRNEDGVSVAADVNATIAANVNESKGQHTRVSSYQRVVQRNGRTIVSERRVETSDDEPSGEGAEQAG